LLEDCFRGENELVIFPGSFMIFRGTKNVTARGGWLFRGHHIVASDTENARREGGEPKGRSPRKSETE
jgi:hypothetical protein